MAQPLGARRGMRAARRGKGLSEMMPSSLFCSLISGSDPPRQTALMKKWGLVIGFPSGLYPPGQTSGMRDY